jgi:hypothetical protein
LVLFENKELLRRIQHKEIAKGVVNRKGIEISNFIVSTINGFAFELPVSGFVKP